MKNNIQATEAVNDESLNIFIYQKRYIGRMPLTKRYHKGDIVTMYSPYRLKDNKYEILSDPLSEISGIYEYKVKLIGDVNDDR